MIGGYRLRLMLAFFVLLAVALNVTQAQGQTRRVLLGYSSLSSNQTLIWVAKEEARVIMGSPFDSRSTPIQDPLTSPERRFARGTP